MGASAAEVLAAREWDVLVVGAGPAGLTAARVLAEQKVAALVLEEHERVGDPVHCTGVLGLETFQELDLPRHTICAISHSARFVGRTGRSVLVDGCDVSAAVVDRGAFDRALADAAARAGAAIAGGVRVDHLATDGRGVVAVVGTADGRPARTVRARACVLACGAQYRFNRHLGLGIPRAYLQTAQLEMPFAPVDTIEIDLDRAFAPGGFAWVVPFRRAGAPMARVGLMARDRAAGRFARYVERLGARHGAPLAATPPRVKLLPLGPVKRTYAHRVLAAGDAAGLAKPTTGGGIYYSLLSGQFAGEVLAGALAEDRLDAGRLREYEARWQARLGPELRAGLAFRILAARLDDRAVDALLELAAVDGILPLLRRTADFNWHRATALALLRHPGFRRIVIGSLWA